VVVRADGVGTLEFGVTALPRRAIQEPVSESTGVMASARTVTDVWRYAI
jgi:hypothetical protein